MNAPLTQYNFAGKFTCLGADCPDTCCRGWDMPADNRQRDLYQAKAPELLATIDLEQGIMKRDPTTGQCAQLCNNICSVHTKYGEQFLGDACYFYPRLLHQTNDHYTMSGAISCPEMLRLLLSEPAPFAAREVSIPRMPNSRRNLVPDGWSEQAVHTVHKHCMTIAADTNRTPEAALNELLSIATHLTADNWQTLITQPQQTPPADARNGDGHALYYALALTEAFGAPGISTRLGEIMATIEQQLDCKFDRDTRTITLGANATNAYPALRKRWNIDAAAALAPTLRRWLQAQLAMTLFPFGGFNDLNFAQRAAVLVQRFATIRLALMCYVSPQAIPPDENQVIAIIQPIARFMDHLADAKLTMMIHQDSGWTNDARLRGLIAC